MSYTKRQHAASLKLSIKQAKKSGLKLNALIIANGCCIECDKIDNLTFPFVELNNKPVIPFDKCIRKPFCICCYGFSPVRDENGRLISEKY